MTLSELEQASVAAMKSRDAVASRTLRMLLARLKNERIAVGHELTGAEVERSVQSEYKKRKEAAIEFEKGGRHELVASELEEAALLAGFLPAQADAAQIVSAIEELALAHGWTAKDLGSAMKVLKERFGASADGALLAQLLKEKLN